MKISIALKILFSFLTESAIPPFISTVGKTSFDFEYEMQLSQANSALADDIKTVFLTTKPKYNFISSSTIKEIFLNGGDVSKFVPEAVNEYFTKEFKISRN